MRLVVAWAVMLVPAQRFCGPGDAASASQRENFAIRSGRLVSQSHWWRDPAIAGDVLDDLVPQELERDGRREGVAHVGDEDDAGQAVEPGLVGPGLAGEVGPAGGLGHPAGEEGDLLERRGIAAASTPPNRTWSVPA